MGNPQTFDIIVGVIFLFFLAAGIGFGIRKMLIIFLTFYAPVPLLLLAFYLTRRLDLQPAASNMGLIGVALAITALLLVFTIMFRMRGARSAISRVLGAAFAAAWGTLIIAAGTLIIASGTDMRKVRGDSITGPAIFGVGDTLMSLLPDNPDSMFKKAERPTI
jgi:hypothetical protein